MRVCAVIQRVLVIMLALWLGACGANTACKAPALDAVPATLAATGCFTASGEAATNLTLYEVNAPLFANNANKTRWLMVPAGQEATFDSNGVLDAPEGSAVFKEFAMDGVRLETRMLLKNPATQAWEGFSYAWNDAQNEATLLTDGGTGSVRGNVWTYPSRAQCLTCHNSQAGELLGLRVQELNVADAYPFGVSQLQVLDDAHIVAGPVPNANDAWPSPTGDASLALRARSYLAANCAYCHMPGGVSNTATDFRYDTPLSQMGVCNVTPNFGTLGLTNAALLVPGSPASSVLSARIHSVDAATRMPPLGRTVEDTQAAALIDAWIASLTDCSQ